MGYRVSVRRLERGSEGLFGAGAPDFVPSFINVNNRPFDVIALNGDGKFSLTVIDDYVFRARATPNDDDGYGLLLRYVNSNTFYRVAMRGQNVLTRVRRRLTVQKAVEGVFEDVFFEEVSK